MKHDIVYSQFFLDMQSKGSGTVIPLDIRDDLLEKIKSSDLIDHPTAEFIKYIKVDNTAFGVYCMLAKITPENKHLLDSAYVARREEELPVLVRFFPSDYDNRAVAEELTVVLYSKEQLIKEGDNPTTLADWNIITILSEPVKGQISPMPPITAMRNALGIEFGGNGSAINREAYMQSVEFWSTYASIGKPKN